MMFTASVTEILHILDGQTKIHVYTTLYKLSEKILSQQNFKSYVIHVLNLLTNWLKSQETKSMKYI
jgi:hypothetical protein